MDGTVTKILKEVKLFLTSENLEESQEGLEKLIKRIDFAIELNSEIDSLIDKAKEI
jgi:hypothetical protein